MRRSLVALIAVGVLTGACSQPEASVQNTTTPIDSLLATGEAVYGRGEFDSTRVFFNAALSAARANGDARGEARALTWLGLAAYRLGKYDDAREQGERALEIKLRETMREDLFKSYNALGLLAWNEGRLRDAVVLFESAHAAAETTRSDLDRAKSANNMALVQLELGRFNDARRGFSETREVGRRLGDPLVEGRALTNLGMLDIELGEALAGIQSLTEARRLFRMAGDRTGEQNALGQLGSAYHQLGESGRALVMLDSALELARAQQLGQEEASNLELIAGVHRDLGDHQRALALYEEAARLDVGIGLLLEQGSNLRRVAEIQSVLGRHDLAAKSLARALSLHRSAGAPRDELRDLLVLAEVTAAAGDARGSAGHLQAASSIAGRLDIQVARSEVALSSARIADGFGDAAAVLRALAPAELERGDRQDDWQVAALRARAYATLGKVDSAVMAGRAAVKNVERLRDNFVADQVRSTIADNRAAPYHDLVNILLRSNRTAEAFEVAEQARNRFLLERFSERAPDRRSAGLLNMLAKQRRQLQQIGALSLRLEALEETPAKERDPNTQSQSRILATELAEARTAYETSLIHTQASENADIVLLGGGPTSARAVQHHLLPNEALIEYLITPTRLIAFVVRRGALNSVAIEVSEQQLGRRVRLARDLVAKHSGSGAERPVLSGLHALLIRPLMTAGLLRAQDELIIVPHSFLTYLPFAALINGSSGRFLIQDNSLTHLPSAGALGALRSRAARMVSAEPMQAFAPFEKELPASRDEVESVRAVTGGSVIRGKRATERRARGSLASGASAHFATHGLMNPLHPMFSRIEFATGSDDPADDGRLEVHELLGIRVRAALVFLSGCETAVGRAGATSFSQGADYTTLAQAFLFAGAESVIATLWKVSDRASAQLAGRFYRHLKTSVPSHALARAQREMLASEQFSHPYYWAPYQLSGAVSGSVRTPGLTRAVQ